jgi:glucose/arabinose dehydrogenase
MKNIALILFALTVVLACGSSEPENTQNPSAETFGSIALPQGFSATVFADAAGPGRHLETRPNGDVYLRLSKPTQGHTLVALRDTNKDGQADLKEYFGGPEPGTGVKMYQGYLYYSTNQQVFRKKFNGNELVPSGNAELVLTLPQQDQHAAKPLAFDKAGNLYVTIGAPSNSCQEPDRQAGVPGQDPCPLLDSSGGIWQFSATRLNQAFADGKRYATGIRHAVGITWNASAQALYAMQHGRDQLHDHWPEHFTAKQSAELPAEEFFKVEENDDFGWPYCYFDWQKNQKRLNPEYGGDGDSIGRCAKAKRPLMGFPGHWAPNALAFYQGSQFPVRYKGGAFIAFHGSWNRAPFPQQGYKVVFVPFSGNEPISGFDNFATQFAGEGGDFVSPSEAQYRPCGLAVGPAGSLYISDSVKGRVWKVSYTGK